MKVVKIIISSGVSKPYYIKSKGMSPSGSFVRVGASTNPMSENMIEEMYSRRIASTLSTITSPRQDLTFRQLKIYYEGSNLALNDQFERSLELVTEEGKYNLLAYLLADNNGLSIKVAKYNGTDKVDLIENEEYGYCSILKAADSVLDKLRIENKTFAKITAGPRIERKLVDEVALREAFINSIVHNDYSKLVPPVIEIYSDRIEITSYGGLVPGLSKADFFNCYSMPRNRELMRIFKDVHFVEQLGSGMGRILKAYDKSVFIFSDNFMKVSFPFDFSMSDERKTPEKTPEKILKVLEKDNTLSAKAIAKLIGKSESAVNRQLRQLKSKGTIERVGPDKGGSWKVN